MTWVKTDDGAPEHMKLRGAGTAGFALWNAALAFCNRNLTDGRIEVLLLPDVWRPLGERFNFKAASERLVGASLWHKHGDACASKLCPSHPEVSARIEPIGGFVVHDYFEYQKSKAEVLEDRRKGADRVKRHRENALFGTVTGAVSNGVTAGVTSTVTGTVSNGTPVPSPVPDPVPLIESDGPPLKSHEVEKLGFQRCGALAGAGGAAMHRLFPLYRHELDDALKTPGNSWVYLAKVIRSARREASEPAQPYQGRAPPRQERSAFREATEELMEMARHADAGVRDPHDPVAGLLPAKGG